MAGTRWQTVECDCETKQTVTDKSVLMTAHHTIHHAAAEEKGARHGVPLHPSRQRQGHTGRSKWKNTAASYWSPSRLQLSGKGLACSSCFSICPLSLLLTHLVKYPEWESLKRCCQRPRWGPQSKGKEQPVEDWAGRRGMSPLPGGAESLGSYTQEGSSSLPPG